MRAAGAAAAELPAADARSRLCAIAVAFNNAQAVAAEKDRQEAGLYRKAAAKEMKAVRSWAASVKA